MSVNHFDEPVAAGYDASTASMSAAEVIDPTVDLLARLARPAGRTDGGNALELAVGTGRVALPLAARGVRVHGIDLSEAMLARLRAKPGADEVTTTTGDMTSTRVPGRFELVYLVFNTVSNVTTQAGQVAVFENAAAHLVPGGRFVVELLVPQLQRIPHGERFHVFTTDRGARRHRRVRRRHPADVVAPLPARRPGARPPLGAVPLRVARRARPDGPDRRHGARAPLGRLARVAVHQHQRLPRLRLAPPRE